MRRGHIYDLVHGGHSFRALVVSDDLVNRQTAGATVVQVHQAGQIPPSMLATEVTTPVDGVVVVDRFATFAARYFTDDLGAVDPRALEAVEIGIRAVLAL